jgi:hypothetical protein
MIVTDMLSWVYALHFFGFYNLAQTECSMACFMRMNFLCVFVVFRKYARQIDFLSLVWAEKVSQVGRLNQFLKIPITTRAGANSMIIIIRRHPT